MKRTDFKYNMFLEANYLKAKIDNKYDSDKNNMRRAVEKTEEMYRDAIRYDICLKLCETMTSPVQIIEDIAGKISLGLPRELFENVFEWLEDKPISDIKYKGLSIRDLMKFKTENSYAHDFISCAIVMSKYAQKEISMFQAKTYFCVIL